MKTCKQTGFPALCGKINVVSPRDSAYIASQPAGIGRSWRAGTSHGKPGMRISLVKRASSYTRDDSLHKNTP